MPYWMVVLETSRMLNREMDPSFMTTVRIPRSTVKWTTSLIGFSIVDPSFSSMIRWIFSRGLGSDVFGGDAAFFFLEGTSVLSESSVPLLFLVVDEAVLSDLVSA